MMTGMSFPQYISSLRISEAERLLQNPKEDVSNLTLLGESLGFSSLSAFQSTFKKYTGMTLSAYREIARKKRG
jgi:AraC-like DNA-binding protein